MLFFFRTISFSRQAETATLLERDTEGGFVSEITIDATDIVSGDVIKVSIGLMSDRDLRKFIFNHCICLPF